MKDLIAKLQGEVTELTRVMKEKSDKGQSAEVKELSDKLAVVMKEQAERKHQFDVGTKININAKELDTRMDELFIASAICTRKDGSFDKDAYAKIAGLPQYTDALKASGFTADGETVAASGTGAEFIPQAFSATLLEEIWLKLQIAALFKRINLPASTYTLPFSPGRLIARASGEQTAVTKDKPKTAKIVFGATKIMSTVEMSDEFEQDSIVPALQFLRGQLIGGFALAQETMCLNGDKGTNIYSAAITGEDCRKLVSGVRADASNASAGNAKVDFASGGMSADNLRALRAKMGKYGKNCSDLAYIVSMADYNKMLGFTGYQALYQYTGAVTTAGELGRVDNIPIIVSELIPGAGVATDAADVLGGLNVSGVWDNTTKTKTTSVLVNKNGYMWGDRKEFSLELWRNPLFGTTNLIGSQRLDFQKVLAATDPTTAVGYNY
jgi:HK97 family phage major capsid protein